jgi:hypothetical protein
MARMASGGGIACEGGATTGGGTGLAAKAAATLSGVAIAPPAGRNEA